MTGTLLDADIPTLHVRCGSDIRVKLREAGFGGDFLEYSDPVCQGPVLDDPDLIGRRATFLADAYGRALGFTTEQSLARLREEERGLDAAHLHPRVVLWFEHDPYDQLVLARCLARFAGGPRPARLELICIDRFPGVARFIGLGQLDAPALASLWSGRSAVTPEQLDLGRVVWAALRRDDPSVLAAIAATGAPALPLAAPALSRVLRELPGRLDGLSLTQRLVLRMLAEAPATINRLFGALTAAREPLPFLGDTMLLHVIEQIAMTDPSIVAIGAHERPHQRIVSITEAGRGVLAGDADFLSSSPPERWIGGVRIASGQPIWRWDDDSGSVMRTG